jgi:putative hydrolase of the HAD superfamily
MLQAVLFDLDNTLVDRNAAFRDCVRAQFQDSAAHAELLRLDQGGRGDRARLFSYWEQQSNHAINQTVFGQLIAEHIQPDRNLIQALQTHSKTLKLGLVTNGSSETQRQKIRAAGLEAAFSPDRIWISAEVGHAKPDAAIFLRACEALGIAPANCLYVGDHEQDDLRGAMNAGLRARLVDSVLDADQLNRLLDEEARR